MVRKTRRKTSCDRSRASSRSPSRFIASCKTMRWCSATSSVQASCSPAAQRCTSTASRPPTSAQLATRACFTETSTIPRLDPVAPPWFRLRGLRGYRWRCRILAAVKRSIFLMVALVVVAGAAAAYEAAARQRDYAEALTRGDAALRDDQTFGAIEAYSGAIALRPDSMLAYLRRGQTYQRRGDRGDLEAAARDFRTAALLDPTATRPLEALGDALYQLQRFERAEEAYERCLHLDDRSARVTYRLALARYRRRNIDAALAALGDAVRLDDRVAEAHYLRGICLREQLQLLASLERENPARQVAVGLAHARAGHWDRAVLTLGDAIERNPDQPEFYRALGQVWLERPRDDRAFLSKAHEALERAASGQSATSESLVLYARALLQEEDVDGAEHALQQATTRYPIDSQAFLLYATTAERQNHLEAARQALIDYQAIASAEAKSATASLISALSQRLAARAAAIKK